MGDLRGKPLDSRRLSRFLRDYDVRPRDIRADVDGEEKVRKGYRREDLHDAWLRYLPPAEPQAGACTVCGEPLDPTLVAAGYTTHGEDGT
jgi:uncharacterized protein DUF3631